MVCKEDVLLWFKNLDGYKRIDILYELLNMCLPFELRFLGSCMEEIGKHTYQEFRGPALSANDLERLSKDTSFTNGLVDETVRHRLIIYVSLLSTRNYSVANWMYKNVLRTEWLDDCKVNGSLKDTKVQSEFLLLFVMAFYHPAFTFKQKSYFGNILKELVELEDRAASTRPNMYGYPPGFGYPTPNPMPSNEVPLPMKVPMTVQCEEPFQNQPQHMAPPQPPQDFAWVRPGFPCGAPEVTPPFRPLNASPLVSESGSPSQSRSTSPHRMRQAPMGPPLNVPPCEPPIESNFTFTYAPIDTLRIVDEKQDKRQECQWGGPPPPKEPPKPNGIRYAMYGGKMALRPFADQFQALSLDGSDGVQRSNSSSGSSPNRTPPETPPGEKLPVNGMAPPSAPPAGPFVMPLCDTTSPPPTFNNCSVPYTTYPQYTAIPTRSIFPFTQSYRPPFAPFQSYPAGDFPAGSLQFINYFYSSPPFTARTPNCYNCGGMGHSGQDCTGQNIEDITQKKTFTIDYSAPPLPDADK